MAPPREVVQALNAQFQKPKVDPEWLEGCCDWLMTDQNLSPATAFPEFMERVRDQLFKSDLQDSMLHGTGLDVHIANFSGTLQGPPVLVQIMAITEIGTSAFQLDQVRAAREERITEGVGNVEGEEDGDVEVEGEGPMPKYPRGTLHFQLSDGVTLFEAMEYRHIAQITLGNTPLGFKLQLKGTRFQNGMAFLEPATVNLHGGHQEDLEAEQLDIFKRGLYERLGRPINPQPPADERAPLRDISPPPAAAFPQHDDDVDMEPRRRVPSASTINNPPSSSGNEARPIAALPRHARTSTGTGNENPNSSTLSHFNAVSSESRTATGNHMKIEKLNFNLGATARQQNPTFSSPSPFPSPGLPSRKSKNPAFDFDLLDEVDNDENAPPPPVPSTTNKGKGRADLAPFASSTLKPPPARPANRDGDSSDYDMYDDDFADADFLEDLNQVEKAALEGKPVVTGTTHPPSSGSGSGTRSGTSSSMVNGGTGTENRAQHTSSPAHAVDVIEIDDDTDNEDKENMRVPTRHVKRRTARDSDEDAAVDVPRGRSPTLASQMWRPSQGLSQRTGKPVVLAKRPSDFIDLSDSE